MSGDDDEELLECGDVDMPRDDGILLARETVPIVFVPGIMGSRLSFRHEGSTTHWDPDNTAIMLASWVSGNVMERYSLLRDAAATVMSTSNTGEVYDSTQLTPRGPGQLDASQLERGWGGVTFSGYGDLLAQLETITSVGFTCPVYAHGYDWRQSNEVTGRELAHWVMSLLDRLHARKCILVTHSMGGLVSRAACHFVEGFADRVAGIVHVAQPVFGGAIAYRRFLVGATDGAFLARHTFDRIIGDEWWSHTSLLSIMDGPMQLVPSNNYRLEADFETPRVEGIHLSRRWLQVFDDDGLEVMSLPHDVYECYAREHPPGMVRPYSTGWFSRPTEFTEDQWTRVLRDLRVRIATAAAFHEAIDPYAHPNTFVVVSRTCATCVGVVWRGSSYATASDHVMMMGHGDGSVPFQSGTGLAPREAGVVMEDPRADSPPHLSIGPGEHAAIFNEAPIRHDVVRSVTHLLAMVNT